MAGRSNNPGDSGRWYEKRPFRVHFAFAFYLDFMLRLAQEQYGPLFVGPALWVTMGGQ